MPFDVGGVDPTGNKRAIQVDSQGRVVISPVAQTISGTVPVTVSSTLYVIDVDQNGVVVGDIRQLPDTVIGTLDAAILQELQRLNYLITQLIMATGNDV